MRQNQDLAVSLEGRAVDLQSATIEDLGRLMRMKGGLIETRCLQAHISAGDGVESIGNEHNLVILVVSVGVSNPKDSDTEEHIVRGYN